MALIFTGQFWSKGNFNWHLPLKKGQDAHPPLWGTSPQRIQKWFSDIPVLPFSCKYSNLIMVSESHNNYFPKVSCHHHIQLPWVRPSPVFLKTPEGQGKTTSKSIESVSTPCKPCFAALTNPQPNALISPLSRLHQRKAPLPNWPWQWWSWRPPWWLPPPWPPPPGSSPGTWCRGRGS